MAKGVGLAIVLGGVITAGAGIANAAPPSGTTLIACSDTKKGDLRLVKAASECDKKKEKVVPCRI